MIVNPTVLWSEFKTKYVEPSPFLRMTRVIDNKCFKLGSHPLSNAYTVDPCYLKIPFIAKKNFN